MTITALKPKLSRAREYRGYIHGFDQFGQQMPKFCGPASEVRKLIEAEGVEIERAP